MYARTRRSSAFTLVELLVVIAIIGLLAAILIPAINAAREAARRNKCAGRQRQLSLAILEYHDSLQKLPGYVNAVGPHRRKLASWAVMLFPYLDKRQLWDDWNLISIPDERDLKPYQLKAAMPTGHIEVFVCPSHSVDPSIPNPMSFAVNTGFVSVDEPAIDHQANDRNRANGLFQYRGVSPGIPISEMNLTYLDIHDGQSNTLMLTENVNIKAWTVWQQVGGSHLPCPFKDLITGEEKYWYGVCFHNGFVCPPEFPALGINEGPRDGIYFHLARPASNHPNGVNAVFCDNRVQFLSEEMDYRIYKQLITPNGRESDDRENVRIFDNDY